MPMCWLMSPWCSMRSRSARLQGCSRFRPGRGPAERRGWLIDVTLAGTNLEPMRLIASLLWLARHPHAAEA